LGFASFLGFGITVRPTRPVLHARGTIVMTGLPSGAYQSLNCRSKWAKYASFYYVILFNCLWPLLS